VNESTIFGVSVRAWLALITVVSGLAFLYVAYFWAAEPDPVIITAVVGFIGLALGYYLGQKNSVQRDVLVDLGDDPNELPIRGDVD